MLDNIGATRILFGSDWPALRLLMDSKRWVDSFKVPSKEAQEAGIAPSVREAANILGETAAKLLHIGQ